MQKERALMKNRIIDMKLQEKKSQDEQHETKDSKIK